MTTAKRAAIYLRVSTGDQNTEAQRRDLLEAAFHADWAITQIYEDQGISGSKGRDQRPQLDAMMRDAARRKFDVVMAWSVDRLGRSLQDLVGLLSDLHASGIDMFLHRQGVDTTTPAGKAMFQMMGVFAEFERAMIRDRVRSGMAKAKAQGKSFGRPTISQAKHELVVSRLREGTCGMLKIGRDLGVGTGTVQRIKQMMIIATKV